MEINLILFINIPKKIGEIFIKILETFINLFIKQIILFSRYNFIEKHWPGISTDHETVAVLNLASKAVHKAITCLY